MKSGPEGTNEEQIERNNSCKEEQGGKALG